MAEQAAPLIGALPLARADRRRDWLSGRSSALRTDIPDGKSPMAASVARTIRLCFGYD